MRRRFINNRHVAYNQTEYLSFEALEDGFVLTFPQNLKYSINGGVWENLPSYTRTKPINSGDIISLQGDCEIFTYDGVGTFNFNKKCNVFGNILSIIGYKNLQKYTFDSLFANGTIVDSSNLILPIDLAEFCYLDMFYNCKSLVKAPELHATNLAVACYSVMFYGCTNLNYIKMLATDISADYCLRDWVYNVASTGTFVKSKDATWDVRGDSGIPSNWKIEYDHNYDIGSDISFHIERIDETLYAKDWMTWDDWVHSKYNTVSARISGHEILIPSYSSYPLNTYPDNIIKNGGTYYFQKTGGGSSD